MWCLCVGVVIGVLLLLCVCDCVWLLIVCCGEKNVVWDVVLVCGCGDWCFVFVGCMRVRLVVDCLLWWIECVVMSCSCVRFFVVVM